MLCAKQPEGCIACLWVNSVAKTALSTIAAEHRATLSSRQEDFQSFCQIVTEINKQTHLLVNLTFRPATPSILRYIFQIVIKSTPLA